MAQTAESLNIETTRPPLAPVVPLAIERVPRERSKVNKVTLRAEAACRSVQSRMVETYSVIARRSGAMATAIGRRIRRTRSEKPLKIVALAAGTAFLLGIAIRIWRSRYE